MTLPKNFPAGCKRGELLKKHTTFGIGGPARYWCEPADLNELSAVVSWCGRNKKEFRVIGGGSNILVSDKGVDFAVIKLSSVFFSKIASQGNRVLAGAGAPLSSLVSYCCSKGLSGLEFLAGIPGTVGGAVVGNAGTSDASAGDFVEFAVVMDYNGTLRKVSGPASGFSYRDSALRRTIVLLACFRLTAKKAKDVRESVKSYVSDRARKQGGNWRSAGCVFKNPAAAPAGKLIDSCGLKSSRRGKAVISGKHANFILNEGGASYSDVIYLMKKAARAVDKKYGIKLQPEIIIWK